MLKGKHVIVTGAYAATAAVLFTFRKPIMKWMEADQAWYYDVLVGLAGLAVAFVPAIPFTFVAAVLGAKYGMAAGLALNLILSVSAAQLMFLLVRRTFSEEGRRKVAELKGIRPLTRLTERNAFWSVFIARVLPFVPAQLFNAYASLTRMSWVPFLFGTIAGKIPYMFAVSLIGSQFANDAGLPEYFAIAGGYALFLALVYGIYRIALHVRVK